MKRALVAFALSSISALALGSHKLPNYICHETRPITDTPKTVEIFENQGSIFVNLVTTELNGFQNILETISCEVVKKTPFDAKLPLYQCNGKKTPVRIGLYSGTDSDPFAKVSYDEPTGSFKSYPCKSTLKHSGL